MVAEQQKIGLPGVHEPPGDGTQRTRQEDEVRVQEQQIVPDGPLRPGVAAPLRTRAVGQVDGLHPVVPGGELVEQQPRTVRCPVGDTDHLDVRERLGEYRLQAFAQTSPGAADGDDDTQAGHTDSFSDTGVRSGRAGAQRTDVRAPTVEAGTP